MKKNINQRIKKTLHGEMGEFLCGIALVILLWLVMYPEFSIAGGCCRVVDENGQVIECDLTDRELAIAVMEADEGEIVIKSQLWEMIKERGTKDDVRTGKN